MTDVTTKTRRVLAATVLAGLATGAVAVSPAMAQERSIKVWFGRQDFIPEDQFAAFKAEYPDIDVQFEVIRLEDVNSQLILALRSGNAPDISRFRRATSASWRSAGWSRTSPT